MYFLVITVLQTLSVYAVFPSWNETITTKVPLAIQQIKAYKELYKTCQDNHGNPYGQEATLSKCIEICSQPVSGLELPFQWLYATAHNRLIEFSQKKSLEFNAVEMLENLYNYHVTIYEEQGLSASTFKRSVMDVVDFLDGIFHPTDAFKKPENILKNLNTLGAYDFFSPIFLTKQSLKISTLNYAFFGEGPFLNITEVGPNRGAHGGYFSQTNRKFITQHDDRHSEDTGKQLVQKYPVIYEKLQYFLKEIETVKHINPPQYDFAHMSLYLIGHEYVEEVF